MSCLSIVIELEQLTCLMPIRPGTIAILLRFHWLGKGYCWLVFTSRCLFVVILAYMWNNVPWVSPKTERVELHHGRTKHILESHAYSSASSQVQPCVQLGLGPFTDLTSEEFSSRQMSLDETTGLEGVEKTDAFLDVENLPDWVDWYKEGAVRPAGGQGGCGSCWAFAAVAAIEGINKIYTGHLPNLSEQELVDCDTSSHGCKGVPSAFRAAFGLWPFLPQRMLLSWGIERQGILPANGNDGFPDLPK